MPPVLRQIAEIPAGEAASRPVSLRSILRVCGVLLPILMFVGLLATARQSQVVASPSVPAPIASDFGPLLPVAAFDPGSWQVAGAPLEFETELVVAERVNDLLMTPPPARAGETQPHPLTDSLTKLLSSRLMEISRDDRMAILGKDSPELRVRVFLSHGSETAEAFIGGRIAYPKTAGQWVVMTARLNQTSQPASNQPLLPLPPGAIVIASRTAQDGTSQAELLRLEMPVERCIGWWQDKGFAADQLSLDKLGEAIVLRKAQRAVRVVRLSGGRLGLLRLSSRQSI